MFCRVLQKQFDEEGQGVVVNSIHPGTKHSKILQQSVIPLEVTNNLLHTHNDNIVLGTVRVRLMID